MASEETTVKPGYSVKIPADIREDLDSEPGDRLRWAVDNPGRLVAEIVRERHGLAEDRVPLDIGETAAVEVTEGYDCS